MTTSAEIVDFLMRLPHISDAQPCTLKLNDCSYPAARYRATSQVPKGSPAWQRGEREHTSEMIYAVGMLPKDYLRTSHIAYTMAGDTREWFIASYAGERRHRRQMVVQPTEYHPFGNSVLLSPWSVPDGTAIDHYEAKPYHRLPASAEQSDGETDLDH
jgi:hypothetical protein